MKRERQRRALTARELIEAILSRYGITTRIREHRVITEWPTIVGERLATRTRPDGLKNGLLWVQVSNSAWLHELSFLKTQIVTRANEVLGDPPLVCELRLHVGRRKRDEEDSDDLLALLAKKNGKL